MPSSTVFLGHLVLPLFALRGGEVVAFLGTSFVAAPGVLVTCWHCVEGAVQAGLKICVVAVQSPGLPLVAVRDVAQDASGADLATARVAVTPAGPLPRLGDPISTPTDVCTWGFPWTNLARRSLDDPGTYPLTPRYLKGYVTRYFTHEHGRFGLARSYEIDMPAPDGLSGAPLIPVGSDAVAGVIYSNLDVTRTEEAATVDAETGKRTPEVQRIVSFALAHHTWTLAELRGPATDGRPLRDLMAR